MKLFAFINRLFVRDEAHYQGVRPIQIYVMRLVFALAFLFVGFDSWMAIITHEGNWQNLDAIAFSAWAAYATMSVLGVIATLRMLPIMVFMIFYKTIWLCIVALPLWLDGTLIGSPAEGMTKIFIWVALPMVAMPWGYFFGSLGRREKALQQP
jgi:hypothetical protein